MSKAYSTFTVTSLLLVLAVVTGFSAPASAQSLLDKLTHATQQIKQVTQAVKQLDQKAPASTPAGNNCGALGAGCINFVDPRAACMAPLNGYHAKMWADVIDERLASGAGITAAQRKNLEEDRAAYRVAEANHTDTVDARISGRMFEDLPHDDQVEGNRRYWSHRGQVQTKCNDEAMSVGQSPGLD